MLEAEVSRLDIFLQVTLEVRNEVTVTLNVL